MDNYCILALITVVVNIGFVPHEYYVTEGVDDFVSLTVKVTSGQLGREVIVTLNAKNESNSGKSIKLFN